MVRVHRLATPMRYPFGRPVTPRPPSADTARPVFLLGAYPSALHVEWTPRSPFRSIRAIAVDDEPEPFWDGSGERERIDGWRARVGWDLRWGDVRAPQGLSGTSGAWVNENVFAPMRLKREDVWITDCLDTYRCSEGLARRLVDTYRPFAEQVALPLDELLPHPSTEAIVREAHRERLLDELAIARPHMIVSLGNAALRVLGALVGGAPLRSLDKIRYGEPFDLVVHGRRVRCLPLIHPGLRDDDWRSVHANWSTRCLTT